MSRLDSQAIIAAIGSDRLSVGAIAKKLNCSASPLILLLLQLSDNGPIKRESAGDKMYFYLEDSTQN